MNNITLNKIGKLFSIVSLFLILGVSSVYSQPDCDDWLPKYT